MRTHYGSVRVLLAMTATVLTTPAVAQEPDSLRLSDPSLHRVYTGAGQASSLDALLQAVGSVDVVLLGESHNDRVGHALQLQIFERIADRNAVYDGSATPPAPSSPESVVLSLEMFERDVQYVLDEYLAGLISEDQFRKSSRPWAEYEEDYRPVVEAAKARGLAVLAANAPRRYVNMVSRDGPSTLDRLSAHALEFLPPLPHAGPSDAYRAELEAIVSSHGGEPPDSAFLYNTMSAQSLWDAAMAWTMADALTRRPGIRIVHLVGSFHVRNGTGIPEQLERYRPGTRRLIVLVEPVSDVSVFSEEVRNAADFVILTDRSKARPGQRPG